MFPVLIWMYVRLARHEELDALATFGDAYARYAARVPGFVPRLGRPMADRAQGETLRTTAIDRQHLPATTKEE
jgi:hypothetical protein